MKVGSHAPPPGSRSGVADYAEALVPALAKFGTIEPNAESADVHLYHLGNNRLHSDIYRRALAVPGVVVLHDAVLHHFLLGSLTREQYLEEWVFNYGEWRRELGEDLWDQRARSGIDDRYFRFSMLRRIIESSRGIIVHNPGAATAVGVCDVIPHFFDPPPSGFSDFREQLNLQRTTTLFGIFGYLRETKRVMPCLASFRRLHAVGCDVALLIAGEAASADLNRLLKAETAHPAIHRLGHLSEQDLHRAAAAVDCCLNLRHPAAGETSGIAIRLMGIGKAVIGSDIAENAHFPETAMLRVSPGLSEGEELFAQMALVAKYPQIRDEIGRKAAAFVREYHALDIVAAQYWQVLERVAKLT